MSHKAHLNTFIEPFELFLLLFFYKVSTYDIQTKIPVSF